MSKLISPKALLLIVLTAFLVGCGGGGSGGGNGNPAAGSDWDSMVWDQGTWS